ncbi:MAG: hypothetical protein LKJ44_00405 [Bifidobacteriaceae bacterium]|jgi:hypothetical protein|nr:hypothetical protein [Bifidobacteriaceae bacterium]MCI1978169.1 hypothetical protein [Bifidobacteriaceae bacterium]
MARFDSVSKLVNAVRKNNPGTDLTDQKISNLENGRKTFIDLLDISEISLALQVPVPLIMIDCENPFFKCDLSRFSTLNNYDACIRLFNASYFRASRSSNPSAAQKKARQILANFSTIGRLKRMMSLYSPEGDSFFSDPSAHHMLSKTMLNSILKQSKYELNSLKRQGIICPPEYGEWFEWLKGRIEALKQEDDING